MGRLANAFARRPWACWVHGCRWYIDAAFWHQAQRCARCGRWRRPHRGAKVERERAEWSRQSRAGRPPDPMKVLAAMHPAPPEGDDR